MTVLGRSRDLVEVRWRGREVHGSGVSWLRVRRGVGACLLLAFLTGCSAADAQLTAHASRPAVAPSKTVAPDASASVVVRVTPRSGPVGTVVRLTATGCVDNAGDVTFNADANDMSKRNDMSLARRVPVARSGDRVTGTYEVTSRDVTGGEGLFYVQCGDSLGQTPFLVTGPVAANGNCPLYADQVTAADAPAAFNAAVAYARTLDPKLTQSRVREDSVRLASSDLQGRGGQVQVRCGPDMAGRTFVVATTRTDLLPSASLSQGVYFVSRVGGQMWVWQQAH